MEIPHDITTQPDPHAAFVAHQRELQQKHGVTLEEVEEALPLSVLTQAMTRRLKMEELWRGVPAACHIYACWNRPASEYYLRLPDGAQTKDQRADWLEHIPWTYIATPDPLDWPDVQLLRLPLGGER